MVTKFRLKVTALKSNNEITKQLLSLCHFTGGSHICFRRNFLDDKIHRVRMYPERGDFEEQNRIGIYALLTGLQLSTPHPMTEFN